MSDAHDRLAGLDPDRLTFLDRLAAQAGADTPARSTTKSGDAQPPSPAADAGIAARPYLVPILGQVLDTLLDVVPDDVLGRVSAVDFAYLVAATVVALDMGENLDPEVIRG